MVSVKYYVNIFQMSKILEVKSCSGFPGKPQFKIILTTSLYKIVDISF
jgi:hypothetical protein